MLCTFTHVKAGVELNCTCTAVCRCASIERHNHQAADACYVLTGSSNLAPEECKNMIFVSVM